MPQPLCAILIGAGNRGYEAYGAYALAHPQQIRFVAVAEPNDVRRARFAQAHGIDGQHQFRSWENLLAQGKVADAALICTLDTLHADPAVAALEAGYEVLLEKPMATTLVDCMRLVQAAERTGRLLQVCHVLRYAPFFSTLHDIVASGRLGQIITVEHRENVTYWHMAHSYVRGHWRCSRTESPMILSKCCHDLDLLYWNLGPCRRLNSCGSLLHDREENAPPGAPKRCTDGCPVAADCPWYAPRLYLDLIPFLHIGRRSPSAWQRRAASLASWARHRIPGLASKLDYRGWPISTISEDSSPEARLRALETGPYGRCVYRCDNDVVDHQVVNMEMESGASAVLAMHGHSHREGRTMRYDGTQATLLGRSYVSEQVIEIHDHRSGTVETIRPTSGPIGPTGHGGGDEALMAAFVRAVHNPEQALTTARESLESHLMAFAAEHARVTGTVVQMEEFRHQADSALRDLRALTA
jgi:predicted dehydrogenase